MNALVLFITLIGMKAAIACSCYEGNDIESHKEFLSNEVGIDMNEIVLKGYKERFQVQRIPEIALLMARVSDGDACALDCSGLGTRTVSKFEFYKLGEGFCRARVITPAMAAKTVYIDNSEDENFNFEDVMKIKMKCY